jgi:protein tyrosine/serine phosphatase
LVLALVASGRSGAASPPPATQPAPAAPLAVSATGPVAADTQPASPRPAAWAQPLSRPGLTNLFKVNDHLYRGAQPGEAGYAALKDMGIKTVICLRQFHGDDKACAQCGLKYVPIPMVTWDADDDKLVTFLKTVRDPGNYPVFIHCQHGSDRTGTCVAIYRMVVEGWTKDQAIDEMTHGGYGFHPLWQNLVAYVRKVDVEALRRQSQ